LEKRAKPREKGKNYLLAERWRERSGEGVRRDGELPRFIYQAYYIFPKCP
jgi:hypothetical protein